MRNVLTSLLITVALGAGAHALWACGTVVTTDGQVMTPAQQAAVNAQLVQDWQQQQQDMAGLPAQTRKLVALDQTFPTQQQAYNELVANGTLPPRDPNAPPAPAANPTPGAPAANPTPPAPPPVVPVSTTTTVTTSLINQYNHNPTSDLIVPQIDLVPDIAGSTMPDSGTKSEVM